MLFPSLPSDRPVTRLALTDPRPGADLPDALAVLPLADPSALGDLPAQSPRPTPLLVEQSENVFLRPGLRGQRLGLDSLGALLAGTDWSPRFTVTGSTADGRSMAIDAEDANAGLTLRTELETLAGGTLRIRHTVTNVGSGDYALDALDVHVPLADNLTEIMDFTGRHEHEREPQRRQIADGTWLRECRYGRPGFEGQVMVAGTPGFDFGHGTVVLVQVAWSGDTTLAVDRNGTDAAGINAGELLGAGEIVLAEGESYTTPWVMVTASDQGLDGISDSLHAWQRSLPVHPDVQPVILNVWEGVMFDHDLDRLLEIARRAARIGVERYVLDDGWFHLRRSDDAGLGDWWVDPDVWPHGLTPLVDAVHRLGMQFGLWFEPEMVNPDSDFYREHPDWVLQASDRVPILQRNQLVADLSNPAVFDHIHEAMAKVLSAYEIDYVKWDHNRDLLEAGSQLRGGAHAVHAQTLAYYRLLDTLRAEFPHIAWESCASGGGRIDMGVAERVSRFWNSDNTDALARQRIQRWTSLTVAPELLGAHISQPTSQQTGRTYTIAFRAATAVFHSFGIEWDITKASEADLDELAAWIAWYKAERGFLHSGREVRLDVADPAVFAHGVVAPDASRAMVAHVQMDESTSNRGVWLRIPGLTPDAQYRLSWAGPEPAQAALETLDPAGPLGADATLTGEALARVGVRIPRCRPETIRLIDIVRV